MILHTNRFYVQARINSNDEFIYNADFLEDHVVIETDESNFLQLGYDEKITVQFFTPLEFDTILDFANALKNKKVFMIEGDKELDATFKIFPEYSVSSESENFHVDDFGKYIKSCFGLLIGKEKEITLAQLKYKLNQF